MRSTGATGDYPATKNADKSSSNAQLSTPLTSQQEQDLNEWYDSREKNWLAQEQYYQDYCLYDDRI
jgi:hypothetical protein